MTDDRYLAEVEEQSLPSAWVWHVYLFFRPREFFRHFVTRPIPVLTAGCAWLYGISATIDRIETRYAAGKPVSWIDDWNSYWISVLALGALGGLLFFTIGGWWFRVRLGWCGAPSPDAGIAKRVYLFSSQIFALPVLIATLIESSVFETPLESLQFEGSPWYLVLLVFPFWSAACSYLGVRTLFEVRRMPALIWFLILPSMVYALAVVAVGASFLLQGPDLDHPTVYRGPELTFSYPRNWWLEHEEADEGGESVTLEGMPDAFVRLMVYDSPQTSEQELEASIAAFSSLDSWTLGDGFARWGPLRGLGATGSFEEGGVTYQLRLFVTSEAGRFMECQVISAEDELNVVEPVLDLLSTSVRWE